MFTKENNKLNQNTNNTISSIEILMKRNYDFQRKEIKLSKIKIPDQFLKYKPHVHKLANKYWYYKKTNMFESPIYLDKHNNLIDGYTSYLLAKMFSLRKIHVWKGI